MLVFFATLSPQNILLSLHHNLCYPTPTFCHSTPISTPPPNFLYHLTPRNLLPTHPNFFANLLPKIFCYTTPKIFDHHTLQKKPCHSTSTIFPPYLSKCLLPLHHTPLIFCHPTLNVFGATTNKEHLGVVTFFALSPKSAKKFPSK